MFPFCPRPLLALPLGFACYLGVAVPHQVFAQVNSPVNNDVIPLPATPSPVPPSTLPLRQGSQLVLNGRTYALPWGQWSDSNGQTLTGISDVGLTARFGVDLENSNNPSQQPILWFSDQVLPLAARLSPTGTFRYLDVLSLARQFNWQLQAEGDILRINTPKTLITGIRLGRQPWGDRLVIDLDRPTPWQISRLTNSRDAITARELSLSIEANIDPKLTQALRPLPGGGIRSLAIETTAQQTLLKTTIAGHLRPQVSMLTNPPRLIVDLRPDVSTQRDILWAPGVRWREQSVSLGSRQYPVTWLEINPRQPGLKLQPIWGTTLVGIQPLASMAQRWQVAAAINGGFFNRDKQLPLGAIRQNGTWISSPILNRGAIAWNDAGEFKVGRLMLQQTLITSSGQRLSLVSLDSGFVQKGIARYTRNWGLTYSPLLKAETVFTVTNNKISSQQQASADNPAPIPIPVNGYLLVARAFDPAGALSLGTMIDLQLTTAPADFNRFPNILGAGPLLLDQGRVVLNAAAEQFGAGLDAQAAPRSSIAQKANGTILIATTHNRVGGAGPTLPEWALIIQRLGAVDALNLDGGSSTALYLGGRLIDRHPVTTTRVQNGIGLFLTPQP